MFRHTVIKGLIALVVLASISCSFFSQPGSSRPIPSESSLTANPEISVVVSASEGGELTLPDKTVLRIPPGSLKKDTQVSIRKITAENIPTAQQELIVVGDVYDIDLGTDRLEKPATLEIPFDPTLLPDDAEPSQVFLSRYDENKKEWIYAGGEVDTNRSAVVLQITHASWWMPTTWNWGAWIAVLNKILRVSIADWIEAVQLLTDDCPQTGEYVQVDSSQSRSIVQGCVERDDAERPELRVVNPKSFFFEVKPISGGNGYPAPALLSPGGDLKFKASTSDPSPLIIEAQMTERSSWYLVVHMVITMLPGANQFGIQSHHIACITERLADVSYFASAAESLLVDHNGAAAAENISQFMLDGDAVRRFIRAADDCNFGPAPTWSVEGIRQIGGAVSTIMSATDYIANYFAGNTYAQISFAWAPSMPYTPTPPGDGGKIAFTYKGSVWIMNADDGERTRITENIGAWSRPSWSPDGKKIAFTAKSSIYVANVDRSGVIRLEGRPGCQAADPSWSPDGKRIAYYFQYGGMPTGVAIMDANGKHFGDLAEGASFPAWSPDGTRIAIEGRPPGTEDTGLYILDTSGNVLSRVADMGMYPDWSPDGSKIVHVITKPGLDTFIGIVDLAGEGELQLPVKGSGPSWSPDGQRIAFTYSHSIFIMKPDGSDMRELGPGDTPEWGP